VNAASNSEWTFYAISFNNGSGIAGGDGGGGSSSSPNTQRSETVTNTGVNAESASFPFCLFDDTAFFRAIEVNFPLLLSPVMMLPRAVPVTRLQEEYLSKRAAMQMRKGPKISNQQRVHEQIPVDKKDFTPRSTLLAAPIIFQTRVNKTATCQFNVSSQYIRAVHAQAVTLKCHQPFACQDTVLAHPEQVRDLLSLVRV